VQEEMIIEVGFNLFFLIKRWSENKKSNDPALESFLALIESEEADTSALTGTFKKLGEFGSFLQSSLRDYVKQYKKGEQKGPNLHKKSKVDAFMEEDKNLRPAIMFFKRNSGSIDVLKNGGIEQVQFPLVPYCTYLSEEEKTDFYNHLPTERDKEKIDALVKDSPDLINRMKIEYEFKKYFIDYPLIGPFMLYTELWKTLSFYSIVILNLINLYSFTGKNGNDRLYSPMFLHKLSPGGKLKHKFL